MDCADRIAVLASERTLEPVRALAQPGAPAAATVRARLERRRLDVTIRRSAPDGERLPAYGWEIREVEAGGRPTPRGLELRCPPSSAEATDDPEDAYWVALEAAQAGLAAASV
ncbi:MAG: hypothetical protein AVDCRST_MAG45-2305 [uncultured Solirubrobacterales bacterium]|uniref:Uncharacterized protein n=1 Tax=uncultured Solirubrobacterales bacterium TaxID=768556 RepID=A0A6J4TB55_9ACTN|nr:MAG: hypothetical protein AVDCRST_MAG45-2305 [uncultured Solirubrobacterales bacterium]